jgi:hypothetical protein
MTIPSLRDSNDRLERFNNPNYGLYPSAGTSERNSYRQRIGYRTYVQFMMDFARDKQVAGVRHTPLSKLAADNPRITETTAGGSFSFTPREQPAHACKRALISAFELLRVQNLNTPAGQGDRAAVLTFDFKGYGVVQAHPLDAAWSQAMADVALIQSANDNGYSTTTDQGLVAARNVLKPTTEGGQGRIGANRIVVLLTDGSPNDWSTPNSEVNSYMSGLPSEQLIDFYGGGGYWLDAPLMQAQMFANSGYKLYPVGIGLGTNYDFMDRLARRAGTANTSGQSPRGSGNPAEYEARLTAIFQDIITSTRVRLVQ